MQHAGMRGTRGAEAALFEQRDNCFAVTSSKCVSPLAVDNQSIQFPHENPNECVDLQVRTGTLTECLCWVEGGRSNSTFFRQKNQIRCRKNFPAVFGTQTLEPLVSDFLSSSPLLL